MKRSIYLSARRIFWSLKDYPAHRISSLLDESQWWPRHKLENFRDAKLRKVIEHCFQYVPYYRQTMGELGLRPKDIQSAGDLHKLPVLTKDVVRTNWNELRAENIPDKQIFVAVTGGTTGEPMKIAKYKETNAWATMSYERGLSWGGLKPGLKRILLTGGSLGSFNQTRRQKISGLLSGTIHLPAFDLGPDNVLEYADAVRRSKTLFMVGYASSIYDFARLLLERGVTLELLAIFTTAERLYPEWADTIRQAMKCKVFSYYGCGECNSIGYQCQEGEGYHVPEEHVILEVENESAKTSLSGRGEVLITDLDNYAMPLLRYRNGDHMTLQNGQCPCGRSLKLISQLDGRIHEFFLNANGQRVSAGIGTFIMRHLNSIDEFQVRQDSLDHIQVSVVASKNLTEEEKSYIRQSFRHYLGNQVRVEIQLVGSIPRSRAQKLQIVINELL